MTVDEYRAALESLTPEQFNQFRERWGGAKQSIDDTVKEFASSEKIDLWERVIIFHLKKLGVVGLKLENEKLLELNERTANAALQSADASKVSASAAASSAKAAWYSQTIALLLIIVTIVLERQC